jgi:hypothetical protein
MQKPQNASQFVEMAGVRISRNPRCNSCGEKGKVLVSVVWASYSARRG